MTRAREFFRQALQQLRLTKRRKHHFREKIDLYLERLKRFPGVRKSGVSSGGVGVVLLPWLQTAVSMYSLECARKLAASGVPVTIVWDPTDIFGCASNAWEVEQLERVVDAVRSEFEVINAVNASEDDSGASAFLSELALENAVQKQRGEEGAEEMLAQNPNLEQAMKAHTAKVRGLLRKRAFDWLLLPGGVWGTSGIYAGVAREIGLSVTTYDSGPSTLFIGQDGIAAHACNIGEVTNELLKEMAGNPAERRRITEISQRQIEIRMRGQDEFRLQPVASGSTRWQWDIVVALNLRWDSAALCRRHLFASVGDWLAQLVAWVEAHPMARLAIRQHPCEKLATHRGTDDFGKLLARHPRLADRATYISAHDTINTYDLMAGAKVVLPFTSRVGIEAAMLGKPVILGSRCFYEACGFTSSPATIDDYFAAISEALDGKRIVSEESRERACVAYYLTECCLDLKTRFTAEPLDYAAWVRESPEKIWSEPQNEDLLRVLTCREPLARVLYRRLTGATAPPLN